MSSVIIGFIRTLAAAIAGGLGTWALNALGVEVDAAAVEGAIFALMTGVYYLAVRLLAEKWPIFGNLFIINKAPTYQGTHEA